jgi:hypothetical protein
MLTIKGSWGAADLAAFIRCYHGTYVKLLRLSKSWGVEWQGSAGGAECTGRLRCGVVHTASYTQPLVVLLYYVRSCSLVLGIVQRRVVKTADLFTVLLAQL